MFKKASATSYTPLARTEGFSVTVSGDETLVYDREQFVIHRLSPEMAAGWQIADGSRDLAAISVETGVRNVEETVQNLVTLGLVQGEPIHKSLLSRRRIMAGAAGAAAAGTFISASAAVSCAQTPPACPGAPFNKPAVCKGGIWQCCTGNNGNGTCQDA
ncbi:MAG: hypothetical protein KC435_01675 [Thermomicrobiales bacterium]|nr:hypothetical protein [Thermomicrobiales bacterium]